MIQWAASSSNFRCVRNGHFPFHRHSKITINGNWHRCWCLTCVPRPFYTCRISLSSTLCRRRRRWLLWLKVAVNLNLAENRRAARYIGGDNGLTCQRVNGRLPLDVSADCYRWPSVQVSKCPSLSSNCPRSNSHQSFFDAFSSSNFTDRENRLMREI